MSWIKGNDIEEVLSFLISETPQKTTDEACYDALLVFDFFPTLGQQFENSPEISEKQIQAFVRELDCERLCIDANEVIKKVKNFRSIRRVIDELIQMLSQQVKEQLARKYLFEIWFKQNSNGDLENFRGSLREDYWSPKT